MNILVCIKQVPDTTELKIDPVKGTLIRTGVPSIMNYDDKAALEEALRLKDMFNAKVSVLSMGPIQAKEVIEEAIAMGADEGYLLSDRKFGGADTWATSTTLTAAIKRLGHFDIIFAGRQAIDGDTAQVGPQIAEKLGIPQITYVKNIEYKDNELIVERELEDGYEVIKVSSPVLLTTIKQINKPRYMHISKIVDVCKEDNIKVLTFEDINIDEKFVGLKGSPTQVKKSFTPEPKGKGKMMSGTIEEMVKDVVNELKEKHFI